MKARILRNCKFLLLVAATLMTVVAIAACGSADEQVAEEAPAATIEPATAAASAPEGSSASADTPEPKPQGDVAPMFTLPAAAGESVSLGSFAGDRNVVLVFYRGFW